MVETIDGLYHSFMAPHAVYIDRYIVVWYFIRLVNHYGTHTHTLERCGYAPPEIIF
jgi:hypothetical protein